METGEVWDMGVSSTNAVSHTVEHWKTHFVKTLNLE
jgi:hypothetical protein